MSSIAIDRVARMANILRIFTWLLLALVGFVTLLIMLWLISLPLSPNSAALFPGIELSNAAIKLNPSNTHEMSLLAKLIVMSFISANVGYYCYLISRIHLLLGHLGNFQIFTKCNAKLLRNFGYALIIGVLISWTFGGWEVVKTGVLASEISFNGETASTIIMVGMVFLSAWIIDIGRELYVDVEYTI